MHMKISSLVLQGRVEDSYLISDFDRLEVWRYILSMYIRLFDNKCLPSLNFDLCQSKLNSKHKPAIRKDIDTYAILG